MLIDDTTYKLGVNNYNQIKTNKKLIVLGNTHTVNMNHYIGWGFRFGGKYKNTAHYTILVDGTVYNHYDTDYYSDVFNIPSLDKQSIFILLENVGVLTKSKNNNEYYTWIGDIYNGVDIIDKKWRSEKYWASYSDSQLKSAIDLCDELCVKHSIPKLVVPHNIKLDNLKDYSGILYKSNINTKYLDITPA